MSSTKPRQLTAALNLAPPQKAVAASKKETRKPGQKSIFNIRAPADFLGNLDEIAKHFQLTEGARLTNTGIILRLVEDKLTEIRSTKRR